MNSNISQLFKILYSLYETMLMVILMIYENLRKTRERIGLTQVEIAKKLNITKSAYCRYENELDIIPLKHLIAVCNIFNISLDYVFGFTDLKQYKNSLKEINLIKSGQRIKSFRKELKLTQKEMAEELKVARSIFYLYESSKYLISTHLLYDMSKTYKISADYLLGRIDKPKYLK